MMFHPLSHGKVGLAGLTPPIARGGGPTVALEEGGSC
jgi:hypothetical protein